MKRRFSLIGTSLKTLLRRPFFCILLIAIVLTGAMSSILLDRYISNQMAAMEKTVADAAVNCIITDTQSMNQNSLGMSRSYFLRFVDPTAAYNVAQYVKNVNACSVFSLKSPGDYTAIRIYSFASHASLSAVEGVEILLYEGWTEADFQTNKRICLIPEGYPTQVDESGAEYVTLILPSEVEDEAGPLLHLQVVGVVCNSPGTSFYVPMNLETVPGVTDAYVVQSCSFRIADNARLDECISAVKQCMLRPDYESPSGSTAYLAVIQDKTYRETIKEVNANYTLLVSITPVLLLLMAAIGTLTGYLTTRGRLKEFAVMRCLGLSRWAVFRLTMAEYLVLAAVGFCVGMIWGLFLNVSFETLLLKPCLVTLLFLVGIGVATVRMTAINTMKLMKTEE